MDSSECNWGKVISLDPPGRLVLAWQITAEWQYDPNFVTEVEVNFADEGPKTTRVTSIVATSASSASWLNRCGRASIPTAAGPACWRRSARWRKKGHRASCAACAARPVKCGRLAYYAQWPSYAFYCVLSALKFVLQQAAGRLIRQLADVRPDLGRPSVQPAQPDQRADGRQAGPGVEPGTRTTRGLEATPLVKDGVIYTTGSWSVVYAIDAKTGAR